MKPPYLTIKKWAEEDRPREKLLLKGKSTLSDAELIAILIGSGTASVSAVELARHILQESQGNLHQLARLNVKELMKFKGIGEAKAISIVAALELGRRRREGEPEQKPKITSSQDVFNLVRPYFEDLSHEEFRVILLNRANKVIQNQLISSGGVSGTVADPKIIFKYALDSLASSIILTHNHPSGNLKPSQADINLTKKIKAAGVLLEIPVLDHLIFANDEYFSFADESLL